MLVPRSHRAWLANIDRQAVAPQALADIVRSQRITRDSFGILDKPTREDIESAFFDLFPETERIADLLSEDFSVSALFSSLILSGIPPLILPEPLVNGFSSFAFDYEEAMAIFLADSASALIGPIVDFCNDALSSLGFEFPTICIEF